MSIGAAVAVLIFVLAEWFRESMSLQVNVLLLLLGILTAFAAIAYPVAYIRCPMCKARWFWLALRKERAGNWFDRLQSLGNCPQCHATCETILSNRK